MTCRETILFEYFATQRRRRKAAGAQPPAERPVAIAAGLRALGIAALAVRRRIRRLLA